MGVQSVQKTGGLLEEFQSMLDARGVERAWPENLNLDDGDPHAHAR